MSLLFSSGEVECFTGALSDHFDSFSQYHTIVVHKEPIKNVEAINSPNGDGYYGYEENQQETIVTFIPVTGSFEATVRYSNRQNDLSLPNAGIDIPEGEVKVKVKEAGRDFINSRKTDKIEVDGSTYVQIGSERVRNFLGLKRYEFSLKETN